MRTLLFLAIITVLVVHDRRAESPPACTPYPFAAAVAQTPIAEALLETTAAAMQSDYSDNEISADDRYKNRLLDVTGTVQAIKKNVLDTPYLLLQIPGDPRGVQAIFDPVFKKALAHVAKGDDILARCLGDGAMNGVATLKDCILLADHHPEILVDHVRAWPWRE